MSGQAQLPSHLQAKCCHWFDFQVWEREGKGWHTVCKWCWQREGLQRKCEEFRTALSKAQYSSQSTVVFFFPSEMLFSKQTPFYLGQGQCGHGFLLASPEGSSSAGHRPAELEKNWHQRTVTQLLTYERKNLVINLQIQALIRNWGNWQHQKFPCGSIREPGRGTKPCFACWRIRILWINCFCPIYFHFSSSWKSVHVFLSSSHPGLDPCFPV